MKQNTNTDRQHEQGVRREDLNQKHENGRDVTRTGSTGSDVNASEWKTGDEEHHRAEDPETGSTTSDNLSGHNKNE